ncbi:MAG TPA: hypothetical protein VEY09_15745 [Pyrinomonadaceae bacterium]|nr:hypothetical protein [Pyrinomonadaceae bacterium]
MSRRTLFALALTALCLACTTAPAAAQEVDRARAAAEIESLREQIRVREAHLLSVPAEDRERYAGVLAQSSTGLVRLLPREKWDGVLSMRGGGSYYSFKRLTHEYGSGSEISLERGRFGTGFGGADFGFLVSLGDVPLEGVTAETEGLGFMSSYSPPSEEPAARRHGMEFHPGRLEGSSTYLRSLPAVAGKTYALRAVSYERADVLVVFRVVRQDSDGSVVLLWKILREFPVPHLARAASAAGS